MAKATPVVLTAAVEGIIDQAVLRRLAKETETVLGAVHVLHGKDRLLTQLKSYNQAARSAPWIILVDLDRDGECAPACRDLWLPRPARRMCFRIVVRTIEAWLLADRQSLARFLEIAVSRIPRQPESLDDPKKKLVYLARHSKRRELREDMVPSPGLGRSTGLRYAQRLIEFVEKHWQPTAALRQADSLRRCLDRLQEMAAGDI